MAIMMFQTLVDNARLGIILGVSLSLPILVVSTCNVINGLLATLTICCATVCVIGVVPMAGWKLGVSNCLTVFTLTKRGCGWMVDGSRQFCGWWWWLFPRVEDSTRRFDEYHMPELKEKKMYIVEISSRALTTLFGPGSVHYDLV